MARQIVFRQRSLTLVLYFYAALRSDVQAYHHVDYELPCGKIMFNSPPENVGGILRQIDRIIESLC